MNKQRFLLEMPYPEYTENKLLSSSEKEDFYNFLINLWPDEDGWVLGHAFNGLLWGKLQNNCIHFANDADQKWGVSIKASTLLDLRIFNEKQELRVWKTDDGLRICMVSDGSLGTTCRAWEENQIFIAGQRIGNVKSVYKIPFSLIRGPAGQQQALPVDWDGKGQKYRLMVRHYTQPRPDNGMLRVTESRLLKIDTVSTRGR